MKFTCRHTHTHTHTHTQANISFIEYKCCFVYVHLDQKLNVRLQKACGKDFEAVCPDVPGYAMIRCLYRKANNEEEGDQDKAVMNKVCMFVCVCVCVFS